MAEGTVRAMRPVESRTVGVLLRLLSPTHVTAPDALQVLIWERAHQGLGGFVAFTTAPDEIRSPVTRTACIHGLWIASYLPHAEIERALVDAAVNSQVQASRHATCPMTTHVPWLTDGATPIPLAVNV